MRDTPTISRDLVEYLERVYSPAQIAARPEALPHEIAALVHHEAGTQKVVRHLRALYDEQQFEDPLNVHEDPEAA